MFEPTCAITETPVELESLNEKNEPLVPLPGLTAMVQSVGCWREFGGVYMPPVKLTVRLSFAGGEEVVTSVETPGVCATLPEAPVVPYTFGEATVPEQPVLVASSNFVQVG